MRRFGRRSLKDDQDFRIESGRAAGGMFLRLIHLPTGRERVIHPVGKHLRATGRSYDELLSSLMRELAEAKP